jgi:hypothetical protein
MCTNPNLVKSHLMPAAFGRDLRGDRTESWIGSSRQPGKTHTQAGLFDYFLCEHHEKATQAADNYAVDFVREFKLTDEELRARLFIRDDVDTKMLIRFACTTIWRYHQSTRPETALVDVGPWEPIMRAVAFDGDVSKAPDVLVCASYHQTVRPELPADAILMTPEPTEQLGLHLVPFTINGVMFVTKLDRRAWSPNLEPYAINNEPSRIMGLVRVWDELDLQELQKAINQMQTPAPRARRMGSSATA